MKALGDASGEITIEAIAEVTQDDAERLGLTAEYVAWGSEPDVAAVLGGTFYSLGIGRGNEARPYPCALVVIDRETSQAIKTAFAGGPDHLLSMLP